MTAEEYREFYIAARDSFPHLTRDTLAELGKTYQAAANTAAETMRAAQLAGHSELTIQSQAALSKALQSGANAIAEHLEELMPGMVTEGYRSYASIDVAYMSDASKAAGVDGVITVKGLEASTVLPNERVVRSIINRVYSDGYTLSDRIWGNLNDRQLPIGVFGDYQYRVKNVVSAGLTQGRDVVKIAKDIQVYVADGKVALMKRYGDLETGTSDFVKRITGKVDWRAMRLARSELYASMQDASLQAGKVNPAVTGEYDWVLTPGADHVGCECPELAAGSPYKEDEVPSYPHPNCLCNVIPRLMNHDEFIKDLKRWGDGEAVGYLDKWYLDDYIAA